MYKWLVCWAMIYQGRCFSTTTTEVEAPREWLLAIQNQQHWPGYNPVPTPRLRLVETTWPIICKLALKRATRSLPFYLTLSRKRSKFLRLNRGFVSCLQRADRYKTSQHMMKYSCPKETTSIDRKLPMNSDKTKRALLPHNILSRILTAITCSCPPKESTY
jgi:hypothetical protein